MERRIKPEAIVILHWWVEADGLEAHKVKGLEALWTHWLEASVTGNPAGKMAR